MCAIEAGRRGRRVVVLEHNAQIGRKILISGGGRCNFTNLHTRPENFLSAQSALREVGAGAIRAAGFLALVERHGIPYHEKTLGSSSATVSRARYRAICWRRNAPRRECGS